jgi:1-pyrroline-5-carboxylate dehydrogenase
MRQKSHIPASVRRPAERPIFAEKTAMSNGTFRVPTPVNEPVRSYAPGSPERAALQAEYDQRYAAPPVEVPLWIGSERVHTGDRRPLTPPHEHGKVLGYAHFGDASHVSRAIDAALEARTAWVMTPWQTRAGIFLRAADLVAGPYRYALNAATMLAQSKNAHQAEIDAACELADFLRFNAYYLQQIQDIQPESSPGVWNRLEYRPLEGFVFAVTPLNFTAIAGNLPASAVLMGNVVVWKPADTQLYSAAVLMELFLEAGIPPGVINLVAVDGPVAGDVVFRHRDFAGLHFTGSTGVFRHLWKTIGEHIGSYRTYPRIVGETGGKDFVLAHPSAPAAEVVTGLIRGAFEYQGQKCSAASRAYLPKSTWPEVESLLLRELSTVRMGSPRDFSHFVNAVIDRKAFDRITEAIAYAAAHPDARILAGGGSDDSVGYFIEPTVILTTDPHFRTMEQELFGPVLTVYLYEDDAFDAVLDLIDSTGEYALTGAVFSRDRYALDRATERLSQAAGNFYLNDKPTGAVVGQQPFGGARGSGTNDKAGSLFNLLRWTSPRTIKETLVSPVDYRYPYLG